MLVDVGLIIIYYFMSTLINVYEAYVGWDIIDLSAGIFRYVGLKLNYRAYVGLYFRGRRLRILIFIVGFDELN